MRDHPAFAAGPDCIKVALNGVWEEALTVNISDGAADLAAVRVDTASDVACEAFFGNAFFGVRQVGTPLHMGEFVEVFAAAAAAAASGPDLFEGIEAALGIAVGRHFRYCELGAEGAWRSVGPLRIDDPAVALADADALWAALCAADVGMDTSHSKALEFTFANRPGIDDTTHWFALPVSIGSTLDRATLESALATFP